MITCWLILGDFSMFFRVPIGDALAYTDIEVRDDDNSKVMSQGYGTIFVGKYNDSLVKVNV